MNIDDFNFLAKLLKDKSGLSINQDKIYLLESRLNPLARKSNFATLDDLIMALKANNQTLIKQVVDAMTTNESFFFRDNKPFDLFKQVVMPYLIKTREGQKKIRIWSAACSSGQEVYSLCMIIKEFAKQLEGWTVEVIGTDISTEILLKAKEGIYTQFEVQRGLPIQYLVKYFTKQGEMWQINEELRNMVEYKEINLFDDFSSLGTFDVIFCRNVLIYFDQQDKTKIFEKVSNSTSDDCFLFLGGAETVLGTTDKFKPLGTVRGLYVTSKIQQNAIELLDAIIPADLKKVPLSNASSPILSTQTSIMEKAASPASSILQKTQEAKPASSILNRLNASQSPAAASLSASIQKTPEIATNKTMPATNPVTSPIPTERSEEKQIQTPAPTMSTAGSEQQIKTTTPAININTRPVVTASSILKKMIAEQEKLSSTEDDKKE